MITGGCVVGDEAPFCRRGCGDHGWQHLPERSLPFGDDSDDDETA